MNNVYSLSQSGVSQESAMQNSIQGQSNMQQQGLAQDYYNNQYQGCAGGTITTTTNSGMGLGQNQLGGLNYQYYCGYPINYYYSYPYYIQPSEPTYEIKVEKVANGFIVHKAGQKYIVSKPEEIVKYLKDDNGSKK